MADDQAVAMHSVSDMHQSSLLPDLVPEGYKGAKFLVPDLPTDSMFTVTELPDTGDMAPTTEEDAPSGTLLGPFSPEEFVTDPTNNVVSAHNADGTPFVIRCIDQQRHSHGLWLHCINQDGGSVMYQVETVQDNQLEIEDL